MRALATVKRRLRWARLRSLGIKGRLLRALQDGYGDLKFIGKIGAATSAAVPDVGLGLRQGKIDASDAFAAFNDDLDAEIERDEMKLGGNWESRLSESRRRSRKC